MARTRTCAWHGARRQRRARCARRRGIEGDRVVQVGTDLPDSPGCRGRRRHRARVHSRLRQRAQPAWGSLQQDGSGASDLAPSRDHGGLRRDPVARSVRRASRRLRRRPWRFGGRPGGVRPPRRRPRPPGRARRGAERPELRRRPQPAHSGRGSANVRCRCPAGPAARADGRGDVRRRARHPDRADLPARPLRPDRRAGRCAGSSAGMAAPTSRTCAARATSSWSARRS